MQKLYHYQQGVGKARHVISFRDGVKTHKDGSPFFDLKICSRKPDALRFIRSLESEGYTGA